eukprot:TRINITY_DN1053_c0_g2_i1.p1 TRINITY_DN1053_c0_g2~~TRINITY_DN1053_c0_g2_i1.p1  ORF type:complete len:126 (+),score=41.93 TRINITY_DN1053_c0_g2_i1:40-378(+)
MGNANGAAAHTDSDITVVVDKELRELHELRNEMLKRKVVVEQQMTALETKQTAIRKQVIGTKPANIQAGEAWVALITDMLCKGCPTDITKEQLGARLTTEVRDLILQCPPGV